MIEVIEGRYFEAQWFVAGDKQDFMGVLYRDAGRESPWVFRYRFRYYASADPHDEQDVRNWYTAKGLSKEKSIEAIEEMIRLLVEDGFAKSAPQKLEFQSSDPETVTAALLKQPYAHVEPTSPGGDA